MARIAVLDGHTLNPGDNSWDAIASLGEIAVYPRTSPGELIDRASGAEVLIVNKTPLSADTIQKLPALKLIAVTATGYNIVDVLAATRRGVIVANVPEYGTDSVAQFVFSLLLEMCNRVGLHDAAVKSGEWERCIDWTFFKAPLIELAGLTMGLIGFGRIGVRMGELANAFGMRVIASTRTPGKAPSYQPFAFRAIDEVFAEADVISLHCPITPQTQGLVNHRRLSLMKPTAMLINTARGGLVVESDLADALRTGRLSAAAIDVVTVEPIRGDNPLLTSPRCLITPHIAWATLAARRRAMQTTAENISSFLHGKPIHVVNG
jgi:glycerate dehydrogenase